MIGKLSSTLPVVVALATFGSSLCQAQSAPMTHHVHDAVTTGQARFVDRLPAAQQMRLTLVLALRNQAALETFLKDLYDPASPSYRQFLAVEEFTARFGPTQQDYDAVVNFAQSHGFEVVGTSRNRLNVDVAGPVAAIEAALHVAMGRYQHPTENRTFYSPDREPTPDLAVSLWRIAGLDNFSIPKPLVVPRTAHSVPSATTGSGPSASFLGSDMRAAYYGGTALTGAGQSLGLLEYAGTDLADVTTYYANAHQTNSVPIALLSTDGTSTACTDNRAGGNCDDTEQTLDITSALGMAPGLSSLVVYVGSNDAPIFNAMATASPLNAQLSCSWGWTPVDPSVDDPYFQEFAAQGQNIFVAAGDSSKWSTRNPAWPADDVYITSVGGTDLATASAAGPWASETAWVDGGGGITPDGFAIPSWQTAAAAGCASCSKTLRNGPDVAANANFTFYVCADQTTCSANLYGGTSFAAPIWAGYLALANQQAVATTGKTLGFINPALYSLGAGSGYSAAFHDITSGNNGFSATVGYDLATGWGSPNAAGLINALVGSPASGFSLSASPAAVSVVQGNSGTSTITSTVTGGFSSAITLGASGQPSGVTVGFSPSSITGAGTSTMTMTVASTVATGTYTITVTGTSGSTTAFATVSLTVTAAPNFSITASPSSVSVVQGNNGTSTITTAVAGGFNSAISLSASGQPSGVTVTFNPSSIAAPGSGTSTMTMAVASTVATGTYTITVTGTGGSITHTTAVTLTVTAPGSGNFTISVSPTSLSVRQGRSGSATVTAAVSGGFNSAVSLSASGAPAGVTATFVPASIAAPGSGTSQLTLSVSSSAPTGTYAITITGTGGSVTQAPL
ncbi:MAG TPA: protease pro-enzyme activation domain-containing protein [Bryobacteraceae bacterium]|nr:protease pro-enzyme activation domain-containing protein [Bryobacteraceae bacterium]